MSGQCPSGWRVFYLFHEFPFILSRASGGAKLSPGLTRTRTLDIKRYKILVRVTSRRENWGPGTVFNLWPARRKADFLSKQYFDERETVGESSSAIFCSNKKRKYLDILIPPVESINLNNWLSINILIWRSLINLTCEIWVGENQSQSAHCCSLGAVTVLSHTLSLPWSLNFTQWEYYKYWQQSSILQTCGPIVGHVKICELMKV